MRGSLRVSAVALLLGVAACSLWVSSEPEQIGCSDEGKLGPPACDTGFVCTHQSCIRCSTRELCGDGVDNDCNGRIDDGCSNVGASGGGAGLVPPLQGAAGLAKLAGGAASG